VEHDTVAAQRTYLGERFQHEQFESSLQIILRHLDLPLDNLAD
jgi:urease accessory protein UreH